ncbi:MULTISPECIES: outer membrane protein assembly factor BamE [Lysobacter]|jgi:outer membrane protein assembly factor BamE|nr:MULTISPECIES: outer membrane protein assembly factor BamE [Lysobacter]
MRKLLLVLSLSMLTAGCGIIYKQPIYQGNLLEKTAIDQLQTGMTKQQVQLLLGTPSIEDPFHQNRWDYTSTQRVDRLGHTDRKNLTLWFENDSLTKWEGDYFAEQDEQIARASVKQFGRNLAKDKDKDKRRRR